MESRERERGEKNKREQSNGEEEGVRDRREDEKFVRSGAEGGSTRVRGDV